MSLHMINEKECRIIDCDMGIVVDVIPGIKGYLTEFTKKKTWGNDGYLSDRGLIPMPDDERKKFRNDAKNLAPISADIFK